MPNDHTHRGQNQSLNAPSIQPLASDSASRGALHKAFENAAQRNAKETDSNASGAIFRFIQASVNMVMGVRLHFAHTLFKGRYFHRWVEF